jgi:hypothetical protein
MLGKADASIALLSLNRSLHFSLFTFNFALARWLPYIFLRSMKMAARQAAQSCCRVAKILLLTVGAMGHPSPI